MNVSDGQSRARLDICLKCPYFEHDDDSQDVCFPPSQDDCLLYKPENVSLLAKYIYPTEDDKDTSEAATHDIKLVTCYFQFVLDGIKTAEIRKDDRGYHVGDTLLMREFDWQRNVFTGRTLKALVTHAIHGPIHGIESGYVMMSLRVLDASGALVPQVDEVAAALYRLTNGSDDPEDEGKYGSDVLLVTRHIATITAASERMEARYAERKAREITLLSQVAAGLAEIISPDNSDARMVPYTEAEFREWATIEAARHEEAL